MLTLVPGRWHRTPAFLGEERRGVGRVSVRLFLLFAGKRKLESLIVYRDAEHQLLGALAAVEPDGTGDFVVGLDGTGFECQGQDLLSCVVKSLFAFFAHGIFFRVLMLNDVVRSGNGRRERGFVANVGGADRLGWRDRARRRARRLRDSLRPQNLMGHVLS